MIPVTQQAHELLSSLARGRWAIDATAGNGYDTEFLAQLVGPDGKVWAFDIQPEALLRTAARLRERAISVELRLRLTIEERIEKPDGSPLVSGSRVVCIEDSHAEIRHRLPEELRGQIAAVMFNLGYLPGADKSCITKSPSTLTALDATLDVLAPGGVLTVVVYSGHPGGEDEAAAVLEWFSQRASDPRCELLTEVSHVVRFGPRLIALRRVMDSTIA